MKNETLIMKYIFFGNNGNVQFRSCTLQEALYAMKTIMITKETFN